MTKARAPLKPRRAPDPIAVDAFISGKSKGRRPHSAPPEGRTVIERKDGRMLRRTTVYMEVDLAKRVGVHAVMRGVDQTQIIKEALLEYLEKHGA